MTTLITAAEETTLLALLPCFPYYPCWPCCPVPMFLKITLLPCVPCCPVTHVALVSVLPLLGGRLIGVWLYLLYFSETVLKRLCFLSFMFALIYASFLFLTRLPSRTLAGFLTHLDNLKHLCCLAAIIGLIIKMTVSSIVIGLKNSYFPLIHLPSCYRTVCYWTVQ